MIVVGPKSERLAKINAGTPITSENMDGSFGDGAPIEICTYIS